jgi:hypothetical protein
MYVSEKMLVITAEEICQKLTQKRAKFVRKNPQDLVTSPPSPPFPGP